MDEYTTIDVDRLREIMPRCPRPELWAQVLELAIEEAEANTVPRAAAFLAQLAWESGECRWLEEKAPGDAYEGRRDLGNTQQGDGRKYKGRGLIQLTGRRNYRAAGEALGIELEVHPEEAAKPSIAALVAAWYWRTRGCNELADGYRFTAITKAINGGYTHLKHRQRYYLTALEALGRKGA
jgi:putative chitinase